MLVFGLPPGGAFRHSEEFRTIFAADELLHVLRGRDRDRRSRDRRGPARRRRARACSSGATRGTTRSRSGRSRCACSSCSRRRRPRARRARTRASSPTWRPSRYADDARLGALAAGGSGRGAPAGAAAGRRAVAARPRRAVRRAGEHRAPDRGDARARPRRGRRGARARRRRGADGARRARSGSAPGSTTRCTCSSSSREDVCYLPAGARHEYRNPGGGTARAICGDRAELPAVTLALGLDVGATKIAAARVDTSTRRGRRGAPARRPRPSAGSDAVLADCRALAAELGSGLPVGLAVCELVDPQGRLRSPRRRSTGAASTCSPTSPPSSPTCGRRRWPRRASAPAATSRTSSTSRSAPGSATA